MKLAGILSIVSILLMSTATFAHGSKHDHPRLCHSKKEKKHDHKKGQHKHCKNKHDKHGHKKHQKDCCKHGHSENHSNCDHSERTETDNSPQENGISFKFGKTEVKVILK